MTTTATSPAISACAGPEPRHAAALCCSCSSFLFLLGCIALLVLLDSCCIRCLRVPSFLIPPAAAIADLTWFRRNWSLPRRTAQLADAKATGPNRPAVPAGAARRSHPIIGRVLHQARGPAASRLHRAGLRLHGPLLDNREPSVVLLHHQPGSLSPGRHSFERRTHQPLRAHRTHRSYRRRDCENCGARGVRPVRFPRGLFVQSAGELGRLGEHRVLQWPRRYRGLPKPSLCPTTACAGVWGLDTRVSAYAEH